jgi:transmembrane sensor
MSTPNRQVRAAIAREAVEWLVRNRGSVASDADSAEFIAWLRASPVHIEEYLRSAAAWRDLQCTPEAMDFDIDALIRQAAEQTDRDVLPAWSRAPEDARSGSLWHRMGALSAIAASITLIVLGVFWMGRDGQRFGLPKSFVTARGELRSWLLPDGTEVELNSNTAITVRYTGAERLVQIENGQALFQVAHERQRRFRVTAGDTGVIAVGTRFDVLREGDATRVTVVEGKVAVYTGDAPAPGPRAALPSQAVAVSAGSQVQISAGSNSPRLAMVNAQQATAWVQRQIVFEQRPLGEVAAEFSRYSDVPIVVQGDALRALPISGVFSAYDTTSFLSFLARLDGVTIRRRADRTLVLADNSPAAAPGPAPSPPGR